MVTVEGPGIAHMPAEPVALLGKLLRQAFHRQQDDVDARRLRNAASSRIAGSHGPVTPGADNEFASALEACLPAIRSFALSLTRSRDEASDLVQDTMMRAWRARASFAAGTNLRGWLITIARNLFLTERRRDKWRAEWCDLTAERLLVALPSQESVIELNQVASALGELSAGQRKAILGVAMGDSYEDVAATCKVAVGTTKSRVARGRAALETLLDHKVTRVSSTVH